jgi:(E)-4-hydroxy-3-methylbut-2-enyl-diphosphate synthase
MLNAPAADVAGNVAQAVRLAGAGCAILRVSVPTLEDARLLPAVKNAVDVPVVADIHFDWRIALACVEAGADKIRLNPGNIGGEERVKAVAVACRRKGVPIRIGVNAGSLEKDLLEKYGGPAPEALVESALRHVRLLERQDFGDIVISIKSSHVPAMVAAYRLLAARCGYPLHLGVTEAGTLHAGLVKNAMGIGALLLEGIGDTLRVSLTDTPEREVAAGYDILRAAGLPCKGCEIISCPTCGRTCIPVQQLAEELTRRLEGFDKTLKVAVMGCVVNGIGEGREADVGLAGGKNGSVIFAKGKKVRTVRENYLDELMREIERYEEP